jgi:hypothetical protein
MCLTAAFEKASAQPKVIMCFIPIGLEMQKAVCPTQPEVKLFNTQWQVSKRFVESSAFV